MRNPLQWLRFAAIVATVLLPWRAHAADHYFVTSDGVKLHVIEAGNQAAPTLVFVPGWTMPAWIFQPQIEAFASAYHVIALDPRGQGSSDVPDEGYDQDRRGQDIAELLAHVAAPRVVLIGWSLGVLDCLAYVHTHGDGRVEGAVLIDNSIGEPPAPVASPRPRRPGPVIPHEIEMDRFVRSMFRQPQDEAYLDRLIEATLRTPDWAARELLNYRVPRSYWREAVLMIRAPVLYVVRPRLSAQADNLVAEDPAAETQIFEDAGHALFVDDAARFNLVLADFLHRRVGVN